MSARDVERLRAGLDEDELTARDPVEHLLDGGDHGIVFEEMPEWARRHILRWTPGRVFREVAAKRQILALYEEFRATFDGQWMDLSREDRTPGPGVTTATQVLGAAVRALAAVYEEAEEAAR